MTDGRKGKVYGVGVGPGDPELMTLKAARLIGGAAVVAYFRKRGRPGHARTIAGSHMRPGVSELPLDYPMTTESAFDGPVYVAELRAFYDASIATFRALLDKGTDIVVLAEGDPLFFGSFMHLYIRLVADYVVEVVPGVPGMAGAWAAAGAPITWGDDILTVLPGTLAPAALAAHMARADALVIMKVGRNLGRIRSALAEAGRLEDAIYVERATMTGGYVKKLTDHGAAVAPYFSIVLVPGKGRRP